MSKEDPLVKILIHKIGLENNLRDDDVRKIINSQYKFIKEKITELDLNNVENEEEFKKLKTNFILKNIGKLHTTFEVVNRIKNQKISIIDYHNNKEING